MHPSRAHVRRRDDIDRDATRNPFPAPGGERGVRRRVESDTPDERRRVAGDRQIVNALIPRSIRREQRTLGRARQEISARQRRAEHRGAAQNGERQPRDCSTHPRGHRGVSTAGPRYITAREEHPAHPPHVAPGCRVNPRGALAVAWPDSAAPPEAAIAALGQQPSRATSVTPRAPRIDFTDLVIVDVIDRGRSTGGPSGRGPASGMRRIARQNLLKENAGTKLWARCCN
jgi:hypothetical protein